MVPTKTQLKIQTFDFSLYWLINTVSFIKSFIRNCLATSTLQGVGLNDPYGSLPA